MIRRVIQIDKEKCNGCGLCVTACHEGAIGLVDGKAELLRDDYCDGLGDCLPSCPTNAISFIEREAAAYDEAAVLAHQAKKNASAAPLPCGCPGSQARSLTPRQTPAAASAPTVSEPASSVSELSQWPVQIKLVPVNAPYFQKAHLLIAADCTAYAYANFHRDFIRGHITLIGCPKLDEGDYSEKLAEIIRTNDIKSVTIVRMQVPCCGGIERAAITAMQLSGKFLPWKTVTISTNGEILE